MDMVRVGLGLGLWVGLGTSELLIADCRYAIRGDRVPVAGTGYKTLFKMVKIFHPPFICEMVSVEIADTSPIRNVFQPIRPAPTAEGRPAKATHREASQSSGCGSSTETIKPFRRVSRTLSEIQIIAASNRAG